MSLNGSALRSKRDLVAHERALAILERLHNEKPSALRDFLEWVGRPAHTQSVTLVFHGGRLKFARLERTSTDDG